jgi:phage shock protein PspC (stress-responsive transcriptional regulator)
MRKVTTINLNNNAYQIDEEGYDALRAYLDNANRALADNPDREEILADLEQALADKCAMTLGPHKTVVSVAEIEAILKEMGPVAGGTEQTGDAADKAEQADAPTGASSEAPGSGYRPHKLYRIREGQKWAGICQGLSAYAGVDVSLVRLSVIIITVCTAFFPCILIYIVMSFILPVAETPEEVASAHGQPFRAQELVDRLRSRHQDRADRRAERWERKWEKRRERGRMRHAAWWSNHQPASPPPGYAARVTGGVMLPVLTVMSAAWFAAMAIAAYSMWHGWYGNSWDMWPPGEWHDYPHFPRWIALVAIIAVYAVIAIPLSAARRASLYYANGGRLHGWADAWSGLLWLAVVAVILIGAWHFFPQVHDLLRFEAHGSRVISL